MDYIALFNECAPMVNKELLMAIVRTESDFRPLAIGINTKGALRQQPKTKAEAASLAKGLIRQGHNIDLGLAQINSANLARLSLTVDDAFDPCKNISAAGHLLQSDFKRALIAGYQGDAALIAGISAYNTGSFTRGIKNGYVKKVILSFDRIRHTRVFPTDLTHKKTSQPKAAQPVVPQTLNLNLQP